MTSSIFSWFQFGLGIVGLVFLVLILILLIFLVLFPIILRHKKHSNGQVKVTVKKLNDVYSKYEDTLSAAILLPKAYKSYVKTKKENEKKRISKKDDAEAKSRVYLIDFKGDVGATQVVYLREQITALLQVVTKSDEVVVRLESPGGLVHTYGLAASQLSRLRDIGISLTVCVDQVAASGGYMMACLANKIVAAPFSILGSIGVLAAVPNFSKLLKKHDVEYFEITAGKYKRSLTALGEPTAEKLEKSTEKLHEIHALFKEHVKKYREQVDIENIATGDYWFGHQAIEMKLIDEIKTSDDYLANLSASHEIFLISSPQAQSIRQKIFSGFSNIWYTLFSH